MSHRVIFFLPIKEFSRHYSLVDISFGLLVIFFSYVNRSNLSFTDVTWSNIAFINVIWFNFNFTKKSMYLAYSNSQLR